MKLGVCWHLAAVHLMLARGCLSKPTEPNYKSSNVTETQLTALTNSSSSTPPPVSIQEQPDNFSMSTKEPADEKFLQAALGDSIDLECNVDKTDRMTFEWFKLNEDNTIKTDLDTQLRVYEIIELREEDQGVYRCVSSSGDTTNFHLTITSTEKVQRMELTSTTRAIENDGKLPKYSGIAIGLGVCFGLLLLSGGAVCLLNFTNNGGLSYCMNSLRGVTRKEDISSLSRLHAERTSTRITNNTTRVLPLQRFQLNNPYDA